tara:strand:+ start:323 stop:598 length:276 start_codon:yes stop_codon:yes gene_type:complete
MLAQNLTLIGNTRERGGATAAFESFSESRQNVASQEALMALGVALQGGKPACIGNVCFRLCFNALPLVLIVMIITELKLKQKVVTSVELFV